MKYYSAIHKLIILSQYRVPKGTLLTLCTLIFYKY